MNIVSSSFSHFHEFFLLIIDRFFFREMIQNFSRFYTFHCTKFDDNRLCNWRVYLLIYPDTNWRTYLTGSTNVGLVWWPHQSHLYTLPHYHTPSTYRAEFWFIFNGPSYINKYKDTRKHTHIYNVNTVRLPQLSGVQS